MRGLHGDNDCICSNKQTHPEPMTGSSREGGGIVCVCVCVLAVLLCSKSGRGAGAHCRGSRHSICAHVVHGGLQQRRPRARHGHKWQYQLVSSCFVCSMKTRRCIWVIMQRASERLPSSWMMKNRCCTPLNNSWLKGVVSRSFKGHQQLKKNQRKHACVCVCVVFSRDSSV